MATIQRIDGTLIEHVQLTDVKQVGDEGDKSATALIDGKTCHVYNSIVDGFNDIWYEQIPPRPPELEAILWHTNIDLPKSQMERRQYHISILDPEVEGGRVEVIVVFGPQKLLTVEPYLHHEMDYTVHDGCDHEEEYCVLDDPESSEYQDMMLEQEYHLRVTSPICAQNLVAEKDLTQGYCVACYKPASKRCAGCQCAYCEPCFESHVQSHVRLQEGRQR